MSLQSSNTVAPELTDELTKLHKVMNAIEILGEQPMLTVIAYGKIWRYADLLKIAVRYAELAQLHGFDVTPFTQWFARDSNVFEQHGIAM